MDHIFSDNTVLDLDDDDDGEDSAHPLPIIIDRKRAPSGSKIPNPHRKRAATVSTRTTKAKNEAKPLEYDIKQYLCIMSLWRHTLMPRFCYKIEFSLFWVYC